LAANSIHEAYKYYQQAEQLAISDAPIIVLWYDQNYSLTRWPIMALYPNSMNYLDMSCVYIDQRSVEMLKASQDSAKKK
ncbi:MAG TPA: ABC transporter substrate-binding protein, partial [Bacteroidia bacterium]|nr:ABC transporter substrate-binding protein [Bacteroidia bacterium]